MQIGAFTKRNWTPSSTLIVSKLVSSYGGLEGDRTLDLCDANAALSQLSHEPMYSKQKLLYPSVADL